MLSVRSKNVVHTGFGLEMTLMEYTGKIERGVVVFDKKPRLAEGTSVRVQPVSTQPGKKRAASELGEMLLSFAGKAKGLPDDMAENHDHYLYGTPKR
jgi:hypothetical protein